MASTQIQCQIMKSLSEMQKHNLDMEQYNYSNQYIRIAADDEPPEDADEHYHQITKTKCDCCDKPIAEKFGVIYNPKDHTIMHEYKLDKKDLDKMRQQPVIDN